MLYLQSLKNNLQLEYTYLFAYNLKGELYEKKYFFTRYVNANILINFNSFSNDETVRTAKFGSLCGWHY
jgi:hypothetical protein